MQPLAQPLLPTVQQHLQTFVQQLRANKPERDQVQILFKQLVHGSFSEDIQHTLSRNPFLNVRYVETCLAADGYIKVEAGETFLHRLIRKKYRLQNVNKNASFIDMNIVTMIALLEKKAQNAFSKAKKSYYSDFLTEKNGDGLTCKQLDQKFKSEPSNIQSSKRTTIQNKVQVKSISTTSPAKSSDQHLTKSMPLCGDRPRTKRQLRTQIKHLKKIASEKLTSKQKAVYIQLAHSSDMLRQYPDILQSNPIQVMRYRSRDNDNCCAGESFLHLAARHYCETHHPDEEEKIMRLILEACNCHNAGGKHFLFAENAEGNTFLDIFAFTDDREKFTQATLKAFEDRKIPLSEFPEKLRKTQSLEEEKSDKAEEADNVSGHESSRKRRRLNEEEMKREESENLGEGKD